MTKATRTRKTEGPLPEFDYPVIMRKVAELKKNPSNPRAIRDKSFKKLVQSLREDPFIIYLRPVIIDEDDMILAGNQRFEAYKSLGYKTIPCLQPKGLTKEQKQALIIKDNVQLGEWDWDVLGNEFDLPKLQEWGMEIPDFGEQEPGAGTESAPKREIIQYNVVFKDKDEYERFLAWIKQLKALAMDPDELISTLILKEIDKWKTRNTSDT